MTLCYGLATSWHTGAERPHFNLIEREPSSREPSFREVSGTEPSFPIGPAPGEQKAMVILFLAPDCPISNAYAPEIGRLIDDYGPRGVAFRVVHSDPRVTEDAARQHAKDFNLRCPVVLDPKHELADAAGATVTPEAAVFAGEGKRVYLGRIDDLFYSFGKRRGRTDDPGAARRAGRGARRANRSRKRPCPRWGAKYRRRDSVGITRTLPTGERHVHRFFVRLLAVLATATHVASSLRRTTRRRSPRTSRRSCSTTASRATAPARSRRSR